QFEEMIGDPFVSFFFVAADHLDEMFGRIIFDGHVLLPDASPTETFASRGARGLILGGGRPVCQDGNDPASCAFCCERRSTRCCRGCRRWAAAMAASWRLASRK